MDERGGHLLDIEQCFIRGDIQMQIGFMDAPKHSQIGSQGGTGPLTGIAMDLSFAVPIVITCPLTRTMAHGSVCRMASRITVGLIGIEHGAPDGNILVDQFVTGLLIGMVADPKTVFAALARDQMNNGWPVIGICATPSLLIRAPARRIFGIPMGRTFFPPHSGRVRRPRKLSLPTDQLERCRSD